MIKYVLILLDSKENEADYVTGFVTYESDTIVVLSPRVRIKKDYNNFENTGADVVVPRKKIKEIYGLGRLD